GPPGLDHRSDSPSAVRCLEPHGLLEGAGAHHQPVRTSCEVNAAGLDTVRPSSPDARRCSLICVQRGHGPLGSSAGLSSERAVVSAHIGGDGSPWPDRLGVLHFPPLVPPPPSTAPTWHFSGGEGAIEAF